MKAYRLISFVFVQRYAFFENMEALHLRMQKSTKFTKEWASKDVITGYSPLPFNSKKSNQFRRTFLPLVVNYHHLSSAAYKYEEERDQFRLRKQKHSWVKF